MIARVLFVLLIYFYFPVFTDAADDLSKRPHMNAETQAVYNRIRNTDGWLLGLGRLVGSSDLVQKKKIKLRPTANRDPEFGFEWWKQTFDGNLPVCFEIDLTQQWGMDELSLEEHRLRCYNMARYVSERGGIPWFRDHCQNHATKNRKTEDSSIPFYKTQYDVSVRLEGIQPGGEGREAYLDYYTKLAREIKAFGRPCVLRLFHEANGMWFWWGGDPENFRAMWKEVFKIFRGEGVKNAIWCYNISRYIKRITPPGQPSLEQAGVPSDFYAGDEYVDILSFDAWFDAPHITREAHKCFLDLHKFGGDRPIFLGELGAKAREDFFRNFPEDLAEYPRFRGVNFWLENVSLVYENSDPLVLKAFNNFLNHPRVITLEEWQGK